MSTASEEPGRDLLVGLEARAELLDALARLTPRQRAVLVLRYVNDLTEAQTAKVLGCSPGTVKSNTSRGLARLRGVLQRRGWQPSHPRQSVSAGSEDVAGPEDLLVLRSRDRGRSELAPGEPPRGPVLQVLADRAGLSGLRAGLCVELRGGL
jgi:DNA-binding CsgD family transcriptional regulator